MKNRLKFKVFKIIQLFALIISILSFAMVLIIGFKYNIGVGTRSILVTIASIPLSVFFAIRNFLISREDYMVLQKYQNYNICYRNFHPIQIITGIVIHASDDKDKYLKRYVDYPDELGLDENHKHWNRYEADSMVHGFIGYNKNQEVVIVNTMPYHISCRCCGNGSKGTYDKAPNGHIQIMICRSEDCNKNYFDNAVFGAALQYCSFLIKKFHLKPDSIISDKEAYDLGYAKTYGKLEEWMLDYSKTMDDFRSAVKTRLKGKN